jgi:hypothetical protein
MVSRGSFDWRNVEEQLDAFGCARLEALLTPDECRQLALSYADDTNFRSRVVMARHGFGKGEYKYFTLADDALSGIREHRQPLEREHEHWHPIPRAARTVSGAVPRRGAG